MKQRKWKVKVLLLLPVLALLGFGMLLSRAPVLSKAPLSFGGVSIAAIPMFQRNHHNPLSPDTWVKIKINVAKPSWLSRHLPGIAMRNISNMRVKNQYLTDARGVKYFWTAPANSPAPRIGINASSMLLAGDGSSQTYNYELNLAHYPVAANPIIFHATYVLNGFQLPIAAVVRK